MQVFLNVSLIWSEVEKYSRKLDIEGWGKTFYKKLWICVFWTLLGTEHRTMHFWQAPAEEFIKCMMPDYMEI